MLWRLITSFTSSSLNEGMQEYLRYLYVIQCMVVWYVSDRLEERALGAV